ncbi:MBL fold metallo-hydrolase [Agromyces sp. Marseille-P2726]|uniref:MBL fold metallo-hydrolase n=1 Tax=Agromyces sp. Marseille-P2726 TaxID=2709132 RepID=UPI00156D9CAE|nr:MBL fold metallo-hydrolase [Agromyces sp. Marseille-P2726]
MTEREDAATRSRRARGRPRLIRNIVPGVHLLEHAYVNCYLLEEDGELTVIDTAHPSTWPIVAHAIRAIGRAPADVRGVVLTHAHFDHLGFAHRAQDEWDVPVLGHVKEQYIAAHPYRYAHENPRLIYPIRHPKAIPALFGMLRAGALQVRGIVGLEPLVPGEVLGLPGHPRVIFTPGHTYGHCALHLPAADAVLSGDALVTFDPYTGGTGPQIVSGAATADSAQALASLTAIADTAASVVLPGHGAPWLDGASTAVTAARALGPS